MHEAQDSVHIQACTHTHRRVHMGRNSYIKMITNRYQLWLRVRDPGPHYWAGSLRFFSHKYCEINMLESLGADLSSLVWPSTVFLCQDSRDSPKQTLTGKHIPTRQLQSVICTLNYLEHLSTGQQHL